jgi:hypothetical protein
MLSETPALGLEPASNEVPVSTPMTDDGTGTPTPAGPTAIITVTPSITTTPQYVNYKRMWLYYDKYGMYIYNASDANRSISPIALEQFDRDEKALNRFDGWRWADFYPTLHPQRCMRIEIQGNPNAYLNPGLCKNYYLSTRSVTTGSNLIFWTEKPNSTEFRVLWKNEVVGECQIAAGFCEVFVP